jgi:hypothetical protein
MDAHGGSYNLETFVIACSINGVPKWSGSGFAGFTIDKVWRQGRRPTKFSVCGLSMLHLFV